MKPQKPRYFLYFQLSLLYSVLKPAAATWSVVGADTATRQVGAAGATCRVGGVGLSVLEDYGAVAGVGAFAAQADASNPSDNTEIARLMAAGQTPIQILNPENTFVDDSDQFGVVTLAGNPEAYTGPDCLSSAGDVKGNVNDYKYSVQGNRLSSENVVISTEDEFQKCGNGGNCYVCDDLADRLMRAIEAGTGGNSQGDSRCIVNNPTTPSRAATSAYLQVENPDGSKYANLNVPYQNLNFDAVADLRRQYEEWRVTYPCPSTDPPPVCSNGVCEQGEDCNNCQTDCGSCGFQFSFCFSSVNTVEVKAKGEIPIDKLQIGDFVKSSQSEFSRVYSFAHKDNNKQAAFVQIITNASSLEISKDHIMFVDNKVTLAKDVKIGDYVGEHQVVNVKTVNRRGLFAPLTENGAIMVSGVRASSYVAVLDIDPTLQVMLYHAMLFPLRVICTINMELCTGETYTDGVSDKFHGGLELGRFVGGLSTSLQLLLVLLCFPVLAVVASTDWLLPSPVLFTTLALAWLVYLKVLRTKSINLSTTKRSE